MKPKLLALLLSAALAALASAAIAHDPRPGPNGGIKVDAGDWHAELVADGSDVVRVFLFDAVDQPVPAEGWSANAILLVDGAAQRFELVPEAANELIGRPPVPVPNGVTGAVQLMSPDGTSAQAKF
jgi:hypothetical protein